MDLKGTLGVRVRRALLRVHQRVSRETSGRIRLDRRYAAEIGEIAKAAAGDRGNHRPSAIYRFACQFATVQLFKWRDFRIGRIFM